MIRVSKEYDLIWEFVECPYYQISRCRRIFNTRTGKQLKRCLNGGSIGYWVAGRWVGESTVNQHVRKIQDIEVPF